MRRFVHDGESVFAFVFYRWIHGGERAVLHAARADVRLHESERVVRISAESRGEELYRFRGERGSCRRIGVIGVKVGHVRYRAADVCSRFLRPEVTGEEEREVPDVLRGDLSDRDAAVALGGRDLAGRRGDECRRRGERDVE